MISSASVIHSDPDIMGGVPVFVGTRVPLRTLLDYLDGDESMDAFLEDFPSVSYRQAVAALWDMAQDQEAFRKATEYVLAKNAELYRRLGHRSHQSLEPATELRVPSFHLAARFGRLRSEVVQ